MLCIYRCVMYVLIGEFCIMLIVYINWMVVVFWFFKYRRILIMKKEMLIGMKYIYVWEKNFGDI